jgi:hypothetical protein
MAKKSLADLVRQESKPAAEDVGARPSALPPQSFSVPAAPLGARQPASPVQGPRYLSLLRKEARLREDQVLALGKLARRLNRAKSASNPSERITENTLIRVAVDALLANEGYLLGESEDDLRRAMLGRVTE